MLLVSIALAGGTDIDFGVRKLFLVLLLYCQIKSGNLITPGLHFHTPGVAKAG